MPARNKRGSSPCRLKAADAPTGDFASTWISRQIGAAERRQMTVLFCDIVGSTALTTHLDPEDVTALLVRYRRRVAEIVATHGGFVARYIGDGVLALWGFPNSDFDDARLAVSAALAIVDDASDEIDVRCALDTGIVVVGHIGASANGEPDIVGRAPNNAARLQHFAPANGVLVSDAVRTVAGPAFDYSPLAIDAAQHDAPGDAWYVKGVRAGWRRSNDTSAVMIGRVRERAELAGLWQRAAAETQHSATTLVLGEAGIGKSTLIADACRHAAGEGVDAIVVGCLPERRNSNLYPVRELLLALAQRMAPVASSIDAQIDQLVQRTGCTDPTKAALLAAFLDRGCLIEPHASSRTVTGCPQDGHDRLFDVLFDIIRAVARTGRLLLSFEDVQWADDLTRAFIERIAAEPWTGGMVSVVLTSRVLLDPPLALPACCGHISLSRLPAADIDIIVANAFPAGELDDDSRRHAVERADGHPLLAIELARLHRSPAKRSRIPELLSGPSLLNSVLGTRLDQLGELKPLTQAAAVLGRQFDLRVLADMLGLDRRVVGQRLRRLAATGVVTAISACDRWGYRFTHALLREVAYTSVLRENREKLHARAADVLVGNFPGSTSATPEDVAQHAAAGRKPALAYIWWRKAAERAIRISASGVAIKHIERALAARAADLSAASVRDEIEILGLLGPQLSAIHGNASATVRATYERCLQLSERLEQPDVQLTFDCLWGLQTCSLVAGRISDATSTGERLVAIANQIDSAEARIVAHRVHGLALLLSGLPSAASKAFDVIHRLYDHRLHHHLRLQYASDQGALALAQDAWALAVAGRLDRSEHAAEAALRLADVLGHPHTSAHVICVLAARAQIVGNIVEAAALAGAGRALGSAHHFPYWAAWAQIVDGWVEGRTAPARGVATLRDGLVRYQATGAEQALPYARLLLAETLLAAGEPTAASGVATEGLRHATSNGLLLWEAPLFGVIAACADASGDTTLAGKLRDRADRLACRRSALDSSLACTSARHPILPASAGALGDQLAAC